MADNEKNHIEKWVEKANWSKKPKAVCKPCWELKYCPYGPLVEDFPLPEEADERSCRIFGHECPVFTVAEPFTETKELRNISRQIPRVVQFRVLKRENQICSSCGLSVRDEDVEFDHIIPWSKGGSSDESNIRLLCRPCNRKRSNKFEDEYLVKDVSEHLSEPSDEGSVRMLLLLVSVGHEFHLLNGSLPQAIDFANELTNGEVSIVESLAAEWFKDLMTFFNGEKPKELTAKQFKSLSIRWGFKDGVVYAIKEIVKSQDIELLHYLVAEKNLMQRLGFRIKNTKDVDKRWARL